MLHVVWRGGKLGHIVPQEVRRERKRERIGRDLDGQEDFVLIISRG